MFGSSGILRYGNNSLILDIDQGIVDFYRSLIPKSFGIRPQKYNAHISVVRKEPEFDRTHWNKHTGRKIEFFYQNHVYFGEVYCWLNVSSVELEEIRLELGLSVEAKYHQPPAGYRWVFHITLGNRKNG